MQTVQLVEWQDSWRLSFADKKKLYGTNRNDCEVVVKAADDKRVRSNDDRCSR